MGRAGSVLVVCTGNVCRSPYLERRLRHDLAGTGIEVSSAGTHALVDRAMDAGSLSLLTSAGIEGADFRARQLAPDLISGADLVLATAREHRSIAARLQPASLRKIITVSDLADLLDGVSAEEVAARHGTGTWVAQVGSAALARRAVVPARQSGVDITDPIGQSRSVFERMAREIDEALQVIVPVLRGPSVE